MLVDFAVLFVLDIAGLSIKLHLETDMPGDDASRPSWQPKGMDNQIRPARPAQAIEDRSAAYLIRTSMRLPMQTPG